MALSKIQAESMNLADTFAFTGTVTGASTLVPISILTSTSTVTSIDFDNLSTDFDTFYVTSFKPATDGHGVRFRFYTSKWNSNQ